MFKYKKMTINIINYSFIVLTIMELIKYLKVDSNLFGVYYLLMSLLIIFLLVPSTFNYKRYYSKARISKFILIIILGFFSSYILNSIVLSNMGYIDSSKDFIKSIFAIKNVIKPILYVLLIVLTIFEFKDEKVIKTISNKNVD